MSDPLGVLAGLLIVQFASMGGLVYVLWCLHRTLRDGLARQALAIAKQAATIAKLLGEGVP